MKITFRIAACLIAVALFSAFAPTSRAADPTRKPNLVFIFADDLGYGDIGAFGQKKIHTPNIDRLAAEGMKFTQHYAGMRLCAVTLRADDWQAPRSRVHSKQSRDEPEGQFPIPEDTVTLGKLLKKEGYVTGGFGKWGLGGPGTSGDPLKQGMDRFYGYNCQAVAHNYYPTYLWDNDQRVKLNNPEFSAHQKLSAGADPKDPASYTRYIGNEYSPDLIAEQARQFVKANKDRPFFLYWPTTVPHLALQVPEDSLAEYLGKFPEEPYLGDRGYLPHRAPRAAYAAMVTRYDREVGRLMDLMKELGLDNNTIYVFTSDNGPLYDRLGGTDTDFFDSASGLRARKGSLYEGGFREPMIVRWNGHVAPGSSNDRVTGFEDWLPTFFELIGSKPLLRGISMGSVLRRRCWAVNSRSVPSFIANSRRTAASKWFAWAIGSSYGRI